MEAKTKKGLIAVTIVASLSVITYFILKNKNKDVTNTYDVNNSTTNTEIETNCKTLAPYLKKCQNPQGLTLVSKLYCDTIAPYQKMCAPYL